MKIASIVVLVYGIASAILAIILIATATAVEDLGVAVLGLISGIGFSIYAGFVLKLVAKNN